MKELIRFIRNTVRLVTVLFSRCKMYLAEINDMEASPYAGGVQVGSPEPPLN